MFISNINNRPKTRLDDGHKDLTNWSVLTNLNELILVNSEE